MSKGTININTPGKRKSSTEHFECSLQCGNACVKNDNIDYYRREMDQNKGKSLLWKGLDKLGSVFDTINWVMDQTETYSFILFVKSIKFKTVGAVEKEA